MNKIKNRRLALRAYKIRVKQYPYNKPLIDRNNLAFVRKENDGWRQPHRRFIELDDTHALMSEQTFKGLAEYSTSMPTGVYDGKMWKGFANGEWYLVWFAPDKDPDKARIEKRKILIV